jgi:hypothetical protein
VTRQASDELTLKALLARYVDPVMKSVGARKHGRRYVRENDLARAAVSPYSRGWPKPAVGFDFGVHITPLAHLDWSVWRAAQDGQPDYRPGPADFLWGHGLAPPHDLPSAPWWGFHDDETFARCGESLREAVEIEAVPVLNLIDDREAMLDAFSRQDFQHQGRMRGTPERTRVLLLIDGGPTPRLAEAIEAVEADRDIEFVRWARGRLNQAPAPYASIRAPRTADG